VRRKSWGVTLSSMPRLEQMSRIAPSKLTIGFPRSPANTKPVVSSSSVVNSAMIARAASGSHTLWVRPLLVPGQPIFASGLPGMVHQPSATCSWRMWVTSPGR